MDASLFAQPPLFALGVVGAVISLRAIPHLCVHGKRVRWLLVVLATFLSLAAPVTIALLGHHSDEYAYGRDVAYTAVATFLLEAAIGLYWVSRRLDPARGRRRCPGCWYDMSASPSRTCPECGRTTANERQLHRTRPSRAVGVISLLALAMSYGALKLPHVTDFGWGVFVPATPMIIAFPYVPEPALGLSQDTPWSLRNRVVSDLWSWQRDLLQWRARRIISTSTDFGALGRAAAFATDEPYPVLNAPASVAFIVASLAENADEAELPDLTPFLPEQPLAAAAQHAVAEAVRGALRSGTVRRARDAAVFAPYAPADAVTVADALVERIERKEERFVSGGMFALGLLANHNDDAWARYRPLVDHRDAVVRRYAVRLLALGKSRRDEVAPLAERALDDPNDEVVTSAVKALTSLAPDFLTYRARLLVIARDRPTVGGEILWDLCVKKCDHPDVLALLRERLRSDDKDQLWLTLGAIERLGRLAGPLRPDLEAFAVRPAAATLDSELKDALDALDRSDDGHEDE